MKNKTVEQKMADLLKASKSVLRALNAYGQPSDRQKHQLALAIQSAEAMRICGHLETDDCDCEEINAKTEVSA